MIINQSKLSNFLRIYSGHVLWTSGVNGTNTYYFFNFSTIINTTLVVICPLLRPNMLGSRSLIRWCDVFEMRTWGTNIPKELIE